MKIQVYTDGASRNNPGPSASGYMIFDEERRAIAKGFFYNGKKTNNIAEYLAIIAALKKVLSEFGAKVDVALFSDSMLVVNQLQGNYKVKDAKLKALWKEAREIVAKFSSCSFESVPRENKFIAMVDEELNLLLDKKEQGEEEEDKTEGLQKKL